MVEARGLRAERFSNQRRRALKILHVAAPDRAGGLERVVEALAVGHHNRGHEVAVAALLLGTHTDDPLIHILRAAGVPVYDIPVAPRAYMHERRAIRDVCRSFRPDIVHTHGYRVDVVDRSVASRLRIPTVTTVHGPSMNGGIKGSIYEWIQRANYRRFDAVVAVSNALHQTTLADGVRADRLHLIPNALPSLRRPLPREEARRELGLAADAYVVGWVGRMLHVKGGDVFLRAIAQLPEPRPTVVMIGRGEVETSLHALVAELGLAETIQFYRDITDAARVFSAFDTYVLSSRSEGLPIVLLEAMAAGAPIVSTDVGGVSEAVGNDEAWLVPPEDPSALAAAINESLNDRAAAKARATRALQRLQREFALGPWLDRYEEVYRKVASHTVRQGRRLAHV